MQTATKSGIAAEDGGRGQHALFSDVGWRRTGLIFFTALVLLWMNGYVAHGATVLDRYVAQPDDAYKWEIVQDDVGDDGFRVMLVEVTSLVWQGHPWTHRLFVVVPPKVEPSNATLMYISASGRGTSEVEAVKQVAKALRTPMAALMDIPNQPLYDGRREDALIAYTFQKFFETEDPDWPLLLPMVKGSVRAMDAMQEVLKAEYDLDVSRFVVSGASKRGWTTWLLGAVDDRVIAIAPAVYNNLNLHAQMALQARTYAGGTSPKIDDYTDIDLHNKLFTDVGYELSAIVDPYAYVDRLTMPKMLMHGTNDPYWPVDALNVYWDALSGPKYVVNFPNGGHDLGDMERLLQSLGVFFMHATQLPVLPEVSSELVEREDGSVRFEVKKPLLSHEATLWIATAPSRDFTNAKWMALPIQDEGDRWVATPKRLSNAYVAFYVEVKVGFDPRELFRLDTPVHIVEPH